jgi:PAS domain S-box-containing protein
MANLVTALRMRARMRCLLLGAALACTLQMWCPGARALNPELDISQYGHTAWKIRDGFIKGDITSIVQTPDGYLWLGTEFGVVRFDGVKAVPWTPPGGAPGREVRVPVLLAARDGTLWIGHYPGLASWNGNKLTVYPELAQFNVNALLEDRAGAVWAATFEVAGVARICMLEHGRFQCRREEELGTYVFALHEDRKGQLWALTEGDLWRWAPGPAKRFALPEPVIGSRRALAEGDNGEILVATRAGVRRFADGVAGALLVNLSDPSRSPGPILRDRHGGLWIGTGRRGLLHAHRGRTDTFAQIDGLSADYVHELFEDREGNIWIGTMDGIDRFREFAATTLTMRQGLPASGIASVLADRDGSIWITTSSGLSRWHAGQLTTYRAQAQHLPRQAPAAAEEVSAPREKVLRGIPDRSASLFQDSKGRLWMGAVTAFGYLQNDRFVPVRSVPNGFVDAIDQDGAGNLWIAHRDIGLIRLSPDFAAHRIPWSDLRAGRGALRLAVDPVQGGLWLGYVDGGILHVVEGKVRASYGAADGLGRGIVNQIRVDKDGTVWVATEGGLSRVRNGRVTTLNAANGLPCDTVNSVIGEDANAIWLYLACGVARIARAEWAAWAAAADAGTGATHTLRAAIFDFSDGIRNINFAGSYGPHAAISLDGKLWVVARDGVSVLDPRNLPRNALPPPLHIEQIVVDRRPYDVPFVGASTLALPPLVRDLRIDYSATSLVAPEKMRFRYKLEGQDRDWQDAGTRRQAFYNDLPPGDYVFRVSASNNSGVWNEAGASLAFSVAPAYYQTAWFRLLVAATLAGALWAAYRWRVRMLAARLAEVQTENRERRRAEELLRKSEATLRASEQEYRTLFDSIDEGFCTIEVLFDEEAKPVDYRFLQINPSFERLTGIKNAVGRRMREIAPQHEKHWFEIYGRIALTGEPMRFENEARQLGRWYDVYAFRLEDPELRRVGILFNDITERKRIESDLRESEARFRGLTELSSDWYWQQDEDLRFTYLSSGYDNLAGYPADRAIGKARWELPDVRALSCTWQEHQADLAARRPFRDFEFGRIDPDGTIRYLSVSGAPIFDDEGRFKGYQGVGRNITDRKRAEAELRRSRHYLAEAQRLSQIGSWAFNATGFGHWSPELFKIHGLDPGGKAPSIPEYLALVHPEDRDFVVQEIERMLEGGEAFDFTKRIVQPDGAIRRVRCVGRLANPGGVTPEFVGTGMDVTEQEQAAEEVRRLEHQLRQAQRLEAMGTLAGGIAHDFNNILGAILGYGEMALRGAREGTRLKRDLDNIMAAGERGRSLVDRVLAFSRSGVGERVSVHVQKVVREALDLLEPRLPPGIRVDARLHTGSAAIVGDPTQVHQVVMNLGTNAMQAMPAGGILGVALEVIRLEGPRSMTVGSIEAGEYVALAVADTGTGIPHEILDHIFDPFFTTKEVGIGTGLGLSLVHGIVTDLGGAMDVASTPRAGSTFTVYLPRVGDVAERTADDEPAMPRGKGQRVLIVDDEEPLVDLAVRTLEALGYEPSGFTSSAAALEIFRDDPDGFDAVITDERMPGMSGSNLIRELRRLRRSIPILLVSGYVGGMVTRRAYNEGADEVLKKPLSAHDLATSLARVLRL